MSASRRSITHRSAVSGLVVIALATMIVWAAAFWLRLKPEAGTAASQPLIVYCAVSLKAPMAALAKTYEQRYHTPVQIQFGASQSLLSSIEVSRVGDLYLPADDSYFTLAASHQLIGTTLPIARQHCVLMVARGNPKGIKRLADLVRPGVRLALANPEAAALGKLVRAALDKSAWDGLVKKAALIASTGVEAANAVKVGAADAAFVWDSMGLQYPAFELVRLPEIARVQATVGVGLLSCSKQGEEAMKFARFLSAKNTGLPMFKANGFEIVDGPVWTEGQ